MKKVDVLKANLDEANATFEDLQKNYSKKSMNEIYSTMIMLLPFAKNLDLRGFFLKHKEEFEKKNYILSMRMHVLIALSMEDEIYLNKIKEEYLSAPYRNQKIEEQLRNFDKLIETERDMYRIFYSALDTTIDIDEVKRLISHEELPFVNKGVRFLYALKSAGVDLSEYVASVLEKLHDEYSARFFGLFLFLMRNNYDATYTVKKSGVPITLNTLKTYEKFLPIETKIYNRLKQLEPITKDLGIFRCVEFVNHDILYWLIPEWLLDDFNVDAYIYAVYIITSETFEDIYSFEQDPIAEELKFDYEDGKRYLKFVTEAYDISSLEKYGDERDDDIDFSTPT